jgi:DNA-binding PadR family transcriptional regulator
MNIQNVILGFLMDEPMSGYDIKRQFELSVTNFFEATLSGIYPALRKMEKDGLIHKEVVIQEGKPNKNVFSITDFGKQAFLNYLCSPTQATVIHSDILVRIFFGKFATREQTREWILDEFDRTDENYQKLCKTKETYQDHLSQFEFMTLEYGIANALFARDWVMKFAREFEIEV